MRKKKNSVNMASIMSKRGEGIVIIIIILISHSLLFFSPMPSAELPLLLVFPNSINPPSVPQQHNEDKHPVVSFPRCNCGDLASR